MALGDAVDIRGKDWDPLGYARFGDLRLRPALDLIAQVPDLPAGDVIDLGCGNGPVARALARRFDGRRLIGVDSSVAMLEKARETGCYDALIEADAACWKPDNPPALIYSNALCHWIDDHAKLFPNLVAQLAEGGTLAVQMPRQFGAPSHGLMRQTAQKMFPKRFDFSNWCPPVAPPSFYARLLAPLGSVTVWESEYLQRLSAVETGHPVRHFTESTAMRPFLARLSASEGAAFTAAYEEALFQAYPMETDETVLFPFRRLFFVLTT